MPENMCRSCINEKYNIKLKSKNCMYHMYDYACVECGEVKHIVADLTFMGRIKLMRSSRIKVKNKRRW